MSAAPLLATLRDAGAAVRAEDGELVLRAPRGALSPLVLSELRDRKALLLALLSGARCLHCEGLIEWTRPAVPFGDGTAAHLGCYEEAEIARLLVAGGRAVAGVVAISDDGELLVEGEP